MGPECAIFIKNLAKKIAQNQIYSAKNKDFRNKVFSINKVFDF